MRREADLGSRATTGSGDAGAHLLNPTAGGELENSPEHPNPDQQQPSTGSHEPRSELEELRYRLAEQEEQLALQFFFAMRMSFFLCGGSSRLAGPAQYLF